MSLRIQNDVAAPGTALDVNRAGESSQVSSGSVRGRIGANNSGGDYIDISSAAESIAAGVSSSNLEQAARVKQLAELYVGGQYNVDSYKVSRALVSNAVSSSAAGEA